MWTRDRMKPLVAAAVIGFPIAIASPAFAQYDPYPRESLASANGTTVERTYLSSVIADEAPTSPAETTARDTLPVNDAEAVSTRPHFTEHVALIALALLSVGAGIFTVTAEKRRMLSSPD